MKETLRQSIARLASECDNLRHQVSTLTTENNFLRTKLGDADHRTRKLIASNNRNAIDSIRRSNMQAAKELAMKTGRTVLVGGQ